MISPPSSNKPRAADWEIPESSNRSSDDMSLERASVGDESSFGSESFDMMELEDVLTSEMSRPFDMNLLRSSIANGSKILGLVEGKDVVLILGKTGVGKSTLIQGVAGRTLYATQHETTFYAKTVQKMVYESQDPLPDFDIGHDKCSKTKCINAFIHERPPKEEIVYLDSPGFEDTDGCEIDIATSVMMGQVAKKCRSLRFVVLINYSSLLEDRGQAIRTVLKIAGTFVKDFVNEKKSFMFLFTHTHEIREMAESSLEPLACLYNEIIRIAQGTKDKDVLEVLTFMAKSLKKQACFVDIILPLETDFQKLTFSIENRLKPMVTPTLRPNCGLTLQSQLKLESESQKMLQRLQRLLQNYSTENAGGINEIRQTFRQFVDYIDIGEIKEASTSCETIVRNHLRKQHATIREEIAAGTFGQKDFGSANVKFLQNALLQVHDFAGDNGDSHRISLRQMYNAVSALEATVVANVECADFCQLGAMIAKLRTWSDGFSEFSTVYTQVCSKLLKEILNRKNDVVKFDLRRLETCPNDAIANHVNNMNMLESFCENLSAEFPGEGQDVNGVLCSAVIQLTSKFRRWGAESNILLAGATSLGVDDFQRMCSRASLLERLQLILADGPTTKSLQDSSQNVLKDLASAAIECYTQTFVFPFQQDQSVLRHDLQNLVQCAKEAAESTNHLRGNCWAGIPAVYVGLLGQIKSALLQLDADIHIRSQTAKKFGIRNGSEDASMLEVFRSYKWFDEYLPSEGVFIENVYIKNRKDYIQRSKETLTFAEAWVQDLHNGDSDHFDALKELKQILPELFEIHELADGLADDELCKRSLLPVAELEQYSNTLHRRVKCMLEDWDAVAANKVRSQDLGTLIERLHNSLCEIVIMQAMDLDPANTSTFQHLQSEIMERFQAFTSTIRAAMQADEQYDEKARYLSIAEELKEQFGDFRYLDIDISSLKEDARQSVTRAATIVQTQLTETSNWDHIEGLLQEFEKAKILDVFLNDDVSGRFQMLLSLTEHKEAEVDDVVHTKLEEEDFRGIGELLGPLAESTHQMKRQKFESYRKTIILSLQSKARDVCGILRRPATKVCVGEAVAGIAVMAEAQREVGAYLKTPDFNLSQELQDLVKQINVKHENLCELISLREAEMNFIKLTAAMDQLEVYYSMTQDHIWKENCRKKEHAAKSFDRVLQKIQEQLDDYFESHFQSISDLLCSLTQLRRAADSSNPSMPAMNELYSSTKQTIVDKLNAELRSIHATVAETQCYDDAIEVIAALESSLRCGLNNYIREDELTFECGHLLARWRGERNKLVGDIGALQGSNTREELRSFGEKLDQLSPQRWRIATRLVELTSGKSYSGLRKELVRKVQDAFSRGEAARQVRDFRTMQNCIAFLDAFHDEVGRHIPAAANRARDLKKMAIDYFIIVCEEAQAVLLSDRPSHFERIFSDFRTIVLQIPAVMAQLRAKKKYILVTQLVFETIQKEISQLSNLSRSYDFLAIRKQVEFMRALGGFLADHYTVFIEETRSCEHIETSSWFDKTSEILYENFRYSHDLKNAKHYAVLGLPLSASKSDIDKAYRELARIWHPDKRSDVAEDSGDMFRKVKEAMDHISSLPERDRVEDCKKSFDELLRSIGDRLRQQTRENLDQQQYQLVEKLLFNLHSLEGLDNLVVPSIDARGIKIGIKTLVKNHVDKVRVDVESNWSARKYRDLNDCITDLQLMQTAFKAYPRIFSITWSHGIVEKVEEEIELLARKAQGYLSSRAEAEKHINDFRRCFLQMGFVLVEMPSFRNITKEAMNRVLESCLDGDWGFGYLFNFGLSLQSGSDDDNEDENRVARILLSEFSHFKEVMTMVWNEEVSQKPVEDSVQHLKAELFKGSGEKGRTVLDIENEELLSSYRVFESEYCSLLSTYINPDADLNILADATMARSSKIKPLSCDEGWDGNLKQQIPYILAGVFALFTVRKSGESYNRIVATGDVGLGKQLLMKPHNIQVLTLLLMFGCGSPTRCELLSQVMQIRTGEGKSMILGAAATIFGLLGFNVRCVCYSEYLSNRDFRLFEDIFQSFRLDSITYSKITRFSEDTTAAKGDIRTLTESMLRGQLRENKNANQDDNSPLKKKARSVDSSSSLDMVADEVGSGTSEVGGAIESTGRSPFPQIDENAAPHAIYPRGCEVRKRNSHADSPITQNISDDIKVLNSQMRVDGEWTGRSASSTTTGRREEILLVDEVDVYFCPEFYGQTYNQVAQLQEPEVAEILTSIWKKHQQANGRRQRLDDVKSMSAYERLKRKIHGFEYLLDNEIRKMLDQVRRVDDEPKYYLDPITNRIGYKVMDGISYEATYGYRTVFAYLKEADLGNLKNKSVTLQGVLAMNVSCGQFSYANISPARILGVSGTVQAMGGYEKEVLARYGIENCLYVPSVYGKSNFMFDRAGKGISLESSLSDYFHRIFEEVVETTKNKRATIVFFPDTARLNDFVSSEFYRKLGRQKSLLTEDMSEVDKEFVISKAATKGQVTICPAVFGRGTDFFCKDERVQKNGGVHIIQAFLSADKSEEVQIQGRTARQGKEGSYQMILLEADLIACFGTKSGEADRVAKADLYDWLCAVRDRCHKQHCSSIEKSLSNASAQDYKTHEYFNSLLAGNKEVAKTLFKEMYLSMKKKQLPSEIALDIAFAIDISGSMGRYSKATTSTLTQLLSGNSSLPAKLSSAFPDIKFKLRIAVLGYRDIDDQNMQFRDSSFGRRKNRFTEDISAALQDISEVTTKSSGGFDIAEDHIGALHRCSSWDAADDWTADTKFIVLLTDAPAHGLVSRELLKIPNVDSYPIRHPTGITTDGTVNNLISKGIDLFFCSFNSQATARTVEELSLKHRQNSGNNEEQDVTFIPMVSGTDIAQYGRPSASDAERGSHIIFVLDESGSMQHHWGGVVEAYRKYKQRRLHDQNASDLVSVIQFDGSARVTVDRQPIVTAPNDLSYSGGGTQFFPAASEACRLARSTPPTHVPIVVFMSDGAAPDAPQATEEFSPLNHEVDIRCGNPLDLHVIAFGSGADNAQLSMIAGASPRGRVYTTADSAELSNVFVNIAACSRVGGILEAEICKRISDSVSHKLSLEYIAERG